MTKGDNLGHPHEGYLGVGEGHRLHYKISGKSTGIPVLFLHGGPGLGCSEKDRRFFDPSLFRLILFDQRGAGQSTPRGSIKDNETAHLIEDISKLLDFLEIPEVLLFGGSWGSTLAVLYGIHCPKRVKAMILRGFFPANKACTDHFEKGGTAVFFPEVWERYRNMVPESELGDIPGYYCKMMQSEDASIRRRYAFELGFYGMQMSALDLDPEAAAEKIRSMPFEQKIRIQNHYSANAFFLPDDFIYNNLQQIQHIPVRIVQGRYDMVCPPIYAYRLHQRLPNSKLTMLNAGHSASEPVIENQLKLELQELATLL